MSFLKGKDPFEKVRIAPRSSRRREANIQNDDEELDSRTVKEKILASKKDYAKAYIEREERNILKSARDIDTFSELSLMTTTTAKASKTEDELITENFDHLYRTYDLSQRENNNLSITCRKKEIVSLIETNQVVIIQGPTGCGKTTQVPQFLFDNALKNKEHCNIVVTQPRRIAAISVAKRVSSERKWPLGTLVGYKVGMMNCTSKDTRITFCTTGILLRKLIKAKHLLEYTHIILDEVHERDQETDFLLIVIRKLLHTNSRQVKVILMSATINSNKFAKYFSSGDNGYLVPAPIIDINNASTYKVNKFYLDDITEFGEIPDVSFDDPKINFSLNKFCAHLITVLDDLDMRERDANCTKQEFDRHVVLIFLPGIYEIEELHSVLQSPQYKRLEWDLIVLHSTISNNDQQKIFEPVSKDYRRIILSTNMAESSITVPNVKYIIDFCLTKVNVVNPLTNLQCLEVMWASKASCEQRAGRTGRMMDGRVYRLVPRKMYEECFSEESLPEILRAPLENLVLNVKLLDMDEPKAILALSMDPPDITNLENTILLLKEAGALLNDTYDNNPLDGRLTRLGYIMAALPIDIYAGKLIALGHVFGILRDVIIVGASISTKSMFVNPFNKRGQSYNAKLKWSAGCWSDLITYLQVYKTWISDKANRRIDSKQAEKKWAHRHFIQLNVLYEIHTLVTELTERLQYEGIFIPSASETAVSDFEQALMLKVVIAGAFYPNYFCKFLTGYQKEERDRLKELGGLDPTTTIYLSGWDIKHNGSLYVHRIQDLFQSCTNNSTRRIRVTFNNSKRIYVTFPQFGSNINQTLQADVKSFDVNVNGKIPISIYKALKLRKMQVDLTVPVLNVADEEKLVKEHQLPECATYALTLMKKTSITPRLPGFDVQFLPIKITHINDPGNFWAVIDDAETKQKWKEIESCTNDLSLSINVTEKLVIGSFVLAPHANRNGMIKYYRGIIEHYYIVQHKYTASVHLIDIGIRIEVRQSDLRIFESTKTLQNYPALAFQCVLANIKPSVLRNINGTWIDESFREFSRLIAKVQLYTEIYSVVNNIVAVKLFCIQGSKKICINDILIKKGYAQLKVESYLSRQNNELRKEHKFLTSEQLESYEKSQYGQDHLTVMYPDPPEISKCQRDIKLRGPSSPLEIELTHMVIHNEAKTVSIENTSVNSILLDPNPEDNQQCLLIASSVCQSVTGKSIILRNTTLMPNIQGLTTLLSLIFAPRIELRCNDLCNRYIGMICGLGADVTTNVPIFPSHDMEVKFDIEINNNDLFMINKLRHWMMISLQPSDDEDGVEEEQILKCQSMCRKLLMEILETDRKVVKSKRCPNFGRWGMCDPLKLLHPGHIGVRENNIFPLHCAMELTNIDPEYEELLDNLEELKTIASEDPKTKITDISCKLCGEIMFNIYDLRSHLSSQRHLHNEIVKITAFENQRLQNFQIEV